MGSFKDGLLVMIVWIVDGLTSPTAQHGLDAPYGKSQGRHDAMEYIQMIYNIRILTKQCLFPCSSRII